ncbi:hypothetical protein DPX16_1809 [Anabarilius grahami]|uniref:Uncharacterized protein n=1 Tax=Anabarilius grahami TaxID=495550 RepID=A0A3N0Y709_ANAGA|nr:hypothetical protein DPX16_1809 [Anabarilius grahami]
MDAASVAAFTEFINHSISRMDQQQESISSTGTRSSGAGNTGVRALSATATTSRSHCASPTTCSPTITGMEGSAGAPPSRSSDCRVFGARPCCLLLSIDDAHVILSLIVEPVTSTVVETEKKCP